MSAGRVLLLILGLLAIVIGLAVLFGGGSVMAATGAITDSEGFMSTGLASGRLCAGGDEGRRNGGHRRLRLAWRKGSDSIVRGGWTAGRGRRCPTNGGCLGLPGRPKKISALHVRRRGESPGVWINLSQGSRPPSGRSLSLIA